MAIKEGIEYNANNLIPEGDYGKTIDENSEGGGAVYDANNLLPEIENVPNISLYKSGVASRKDYSFDPIEKEIDDLSISSGVNDDEKVYLKQLRSAGLPKEEIYKAIKVVGGDDPIQKQKGQTWYKDPETGLPIPLAPGQKPPEGSSMESVWGSQESANDDGLITTYAKNIANTLPSFMQHFAQAFALPQTLITGEEPQWYKELEGRQETLKGKSSEASQEAFFKTENVKEWGDIFKADNWHFTPDNVVGNVSKLVSTVAEFAAANFLTGGMAWGAEAAEGALALKEAETAYKAGKIGLDMYNKVKTSAAALKYGKYASQLGAGMMVNMPEAIQMAKEAGLNDREAYGFGALVSVPVALVEMNLGLGAKLLGNAAAKAEKSAIVKSAVSQLEKDASGKITEASLANAYSSFQKGTASYVRRMASNRLKDALPEASEEIIQSAIQKGGAQIYDTLFAKNKEVGEGKFGEEVLSAKSFGDYLNDGIGGFLGGAMGGSFIPGAGLRAGFKKSKEEVQSENVFQAVKQGNVGTLGLYAELMQAKKLGLITDEDLAQAHFKIKAFQQYDAKTKDLTLNDEEKQQMFHLTFQSENLKSQISQLEKKTDADPLDAARINNLKNLYAENQKEIDALMAGKTKAEAKAETKKGKEEIKNQKQAAKDKAEPTSEYNVGDTFTHPKYGEVTVSAVLPNGSVSFTTKDNKKIPVPKSKLGDFTKTGTQQQTTDTTSQGAAVTQDDTEDKATEVLNIQKMANARVAGDMSNLTKENVVESLELKGAKPSQAKASFKRDINGKQIVIENGKLIQPEDTTEVIENEVQPDGSVIKVKKQRKVAAKVLDAHDMVDQYGNKYVIAVQDPYNVKDKKDNTKTKKIGTTYLVRLNEDGTVHSHTMYYAEADIDGVFTYDDLAETKKRLGLKPAEKAVKQKQAKAPKQAKQKKVKKTNYTTAINNASEEELKDLEEKIKAEDAMSPAVEKRIAKRKEALAKKKQKEGISVGTAASKSLVNKAKRRKKSLSQELIGFVWKRLAKQGVDNADSIIGTRDTIDNIDFDKFWSNVTKEDLENLKKLYETQKQKQLDLYNKFKGEFDPSTGTITSNDTSFFDNKIKNVNAELDALEGKPTETKTGKPSGQQTSLDIGLKPPYTILGDVINLIKTKAGKAIRGTVINLGTTYRNQIGVVVKIGGRKQIARIASSSIVGKFGTEASKFEGKTVTLKLVNYGEKDALGNVWTDNIINPVTKQPYGPKVEVYADGKFIGNLQATDYKPEESQETETFDDMVKRATPITANETWDKNKDKIKKKFPDLSKQDFLAMSPEARENMIKCI